MRRISAHAGACLALTSSIALSTFSYGSVIAECVDYGTLMHWVGGADTPGEARDVAISGNYAYVADAPFGLQVIDITDPENPRIVGSVDTPGRRNSVAISGTWAYIADLDSPFGLLVVDITNPRSPQILGYVDTPGAPARVTVSGTYAYVASPKLFYVLDITDPLRSRILGTLIGAPNQVNGLAVCGAYAYVSGHSELQVIDISNPETPRIVGSLATGGALAVAVSGSTVYVADSGRLRVIDITNPERPQIVGNLAMLGGAKAVAVSGSTVYVAGSYRLHVIDITNPQDPQLVGSLGTPDRAYGVAVSGSFAYVANASSGLQVFEMTNPQSPPIVGSVDLPDESYDVAISGKFACVVGDDSDSVGHFSIIDISTQAHPLLVGRMNIQNALAERVAVSGTYAYVSGALVVYDYDYVPHLWVIDISDPARPRSVGHLNARACGLAVSGRFAYAANWGSGLQVIAITNPTSPQIVGSADTPGQASHVTVSGHFAYVADGSSGLQVIDITDPASPRIVGTVDTPGQAIFVAVSGHSAYVADGSSGLKVIDITNPTNPQIVGSVDTPERAWGAWGIRGVAVSGTAAYLTMGNALQVIDITNPASPQLVGGSVAVESDGITVSSDYVYVAGGNTGFKTLPFQCDSAAHQPPLASAGGPYTGECHLPLTFDATGSVAQDGRIVSYEWDWDGDGVFDESTVSPTITHTYETTFAGNVRLRVTDDQNPPMASESDAAVSVADTKAPEIVNVALIPEVEWNKNQQRVAFSLGVEVRDLCDPNPARRIASVTTDPPRQPNGNHALRGDWEITDALSLQLPLDFSLGRQGRLYHVTVVSSDETGNATAAVAEIRVAFDRGRPLILLESLDLDQALPLGLEAHIRHSSSSGSGETEEVAKSNPSTQGQDAIYALGLVGTFPNPMGQQGQVQFFLPMAAQVRLAIYDVRGRLVRSLAQGSYSPGLHSASCESRSDDGSILSRGIYFARLDVDGQRFTRRFVVVH